MLFRIEGTDVYLFGSIHFGKPSLYPLPTPVNQAFTSAKQVWLECKDDPDAYSRRSKFEGGAELKDFVSVTTFEKLKEAARRFNLNFDVLRFLRPWAVVFAFERHFSEVEGYSSKYGLDNHFKARADFSGQPLYYFETTDAQLDVLNSATKEEQEAFLARTLFHPTEGKFDIRNLFTAWAGSDVAALNALLDREIERYQFYKPLVFGRNRAWIPKLKTLVESGISAFVCVGILHFAGEQSLPLLLRENYGYNVAKVPLERPLGIV